MHSVDRETGRITRTKLRRKEVLEFFAHQLIALGHEVKLLPSRLVQVFILRNKTDAADAQAIWTAAQQPGIKVVAVKSSVQQSVLALHRLRAQLMKMRIMQSNALRGLQ